MRSESAPPSRNPSGESLSSPAWPLRSCRSGSTHPLIASSASVPPSLTRNSTSLQNQAAIFLPSRRFLKLCPVPGMSPLLPLLTYQNFTWALSPSQKAPPPRAHPEADIPLAGTTGHSSFASSKDQCVCVSLPPPTCFCGCSINICRMNEKETKRERESRLSNPEPTSGVSQLPVAGPGTRVWYCGLSQALGPPPKTRGLSPAYPPIPSLTAPGQEDPLLSLRDLEGKRLSWAPPQVRAESGCPKHWKSTCWPGTSTLNFENLESCFCLIWGWELPRSGEQGGTPGWHGGISGEWHGGGWQGVQ